MIIIYYMNDNHILYERGHMCNMTYIFTEYNCVTTIL